MQSGAGQRGRARGLTVSAYREAAEFYDLLYGDKDYDAEVDRLVEVLAKYGVVRGDLLDVGCGTGAHALHLSQRGFRVDGVDIEPAFVAQAARKVPDGRFLVGDMTTFDLGQEFDVVTCLFSAIGYTKTTEHLTRAVERMASHLRPGGVLIVDPWFGPGELTQGWILVLTATKDDTTVCRMSRTVVEGPVSRLEFEYLIGRPTGIERRTETHELGLFTDEEMEGAFRAAGLVVDHLPKGDRDRGLYVGVQADDQD